MFQFFIFFLNHLNPFLFPSEEFFLIFASLLLFVWATFFVKEYHLEQVPDSDESNPNEKIEDILSQLTLKEKLTLCHASSAFTSGGVPRLGIPEMVMSDGPHGVRHEHSRDWSLDTNADDKSTYLPTGITLSSTWNRNLGFSYGAVLGNEAKHRGKDIILGPGINIIRSPLNGRNFEYLSEDSYLTAQMAVGYIKGVQKQGVAACAKHFAANNQETNRAIVDTIVSKRALQEIYFPAFKAAVKDAGVWSIMGAYNKLNGQYTTHHAYLHSVLKSDWNFDGALISDWASVKDSKEALIYGTDIEMGTELLRTFDHPDYEEFYLAKEAEELIQSGEISESFVDDKVRRILKLMFRSTVLGTHTNGKRNTAEHQKIALQVAQEGIVLLKNDGVLPLKASSKQKIAVFGHNAIRKFAHRGGSSQVNALYEVTALEGIKSIAGPEFTVDFEPGYEPYFDEHDYRKVNIQSAAQPRSKSNAVEKVHSESSHLMLKEKALALANQSDIIVFVGGWIHGLDGFEWGDATFDAEARDKLNLTLPFGQEELISELQKLKKKVIVVLYGGSQADMTWLSESNAYLHVWYPGMEGGTALAQILFGEINPSGKLPVTFANSVDEFSSHSIGEFPGDESVHYHEDIFVGYRHFATKQIPVAFPFGFGLSYTSFAFSDLELFIQDDELLQVSCNVANTGMIAGFEVVQLYVNQQNPSIERPAIELKGFDKVWLEPNEKKNVRFSIHRDDLKFFHPEKKWLFESDWYTFFLGNSSSNLPLSKRIYL